MPLILISNSKLSLYSRAQRCGQSAEPKLSSTTAESSAKQVGNGLTRAATVWRRDDVITCDMIPYLFSGIR